MTQTEPIIQTSLVVAIDRLAPNPLNPRSRLGDLAELTRSIKAHGVLQPLLVLPADADGVHVIVAGHRRHAAAFAAGVAALPVVVRDLNESEQIEVALSENGNRDGLDIADEITAIERLMSLDDALTPAKLSKRIGKSQAWVRDRMTVTILPASWRTALTKGTLTMSAAVAAASVADLGTEHVDGVCTLLGDRSWRDPKQVVDDYRRDLRRGAAFDAAVAKHARDSVVYCEANPLPTTAKRLDALGMTGDQQTAHRSEPCHAVLVTKGWGEKPDIAGVCTEPRRHRSGRGGDSASSLVTSPDRPVGDDGHAKRKARLARLAYGAEVFARRRGGPTTGELTALALPFLVETAGHEALSFAAKLLGLETDRPHQALTALAVESPAALARVAAAVACGIAELHAYHSTGSTVTAWYRLLVNHGWEPDPWTSTRISTADSEAAG